VCTHVAVYDVDVSAQDAGGSRYRAELKHRRTGVTDVLHGSVEGEGPAMRVTVQDEEGTSRTVAMHEFPEIIARVLLRPFALDAVALTG